MQASNRTRLPLLGLACAVLLSQLGIVASRYHGWLGLSDFVEYWSAGQLLRGGQNPYDVDALHAVQQELGWTREQPLRMWNPPWLLHL